MTENQCSELLRLSKSLTDQLKSRMRINKVEALERALGAMLHDSLIMFNKKPIELVRANKGLLSHVAG
jgi:hypothetical protein